MFHRTSRILSAAFHRLAVNLAKSAKVSLEVYNIVGRKFMKFRPQPWRRNHTFQINAASLKSGIYTYSVIANGGAPPAK